MNDEALQEALVAIPETDWEARQAVIKSNREYKESLRIERHSTVLARLHAEWFTGVVGIFIDPTVESQAVTKDGTIMLGTGMHFRKCDASFTFHELGHFLEIETYRMGKKNWGLRYPRSKMYSRGRYGWGKEYFPKTFKSLERELRVLAIEDTLRKHFDPEGYAKLGRELIEKGTLLDSVVGARLCPGSNDQERTEWCLKQYEKLLATYTYEGLHAEWLRRTKLLKRRMQARARRARKVETFLTH